MKNLLKNISLFAILATALVSFAACSEDSFDDNNIEVTFKAMIPSTRAFGDGSQADSLVVGVLKKSNDTYTEIARKQVDINASLADVSFILGKGQSYTFVFWAQNKDCTLYDLTDLTAIGMASHSGAITFADAEKCDAFYYVETIDNVTKSINKSVELARPLVQVNVGTTGAAKTAKFVAKAIPNTFNPIDGSVSGSTDYTWEFSATTSEKFTVESVNYTYIAIAYMFAPKSEATEYEAELTVEGMAPRTLPAILLQQNTKCNILGALTE